jgi:hypothetical protein
LSPALDHYFITASAPDIDALDAGRIAGWQRTGLTFLVEGTAIVELGVLQPVCRFYIPPFEGDSHFFSAFPGECSQLGAKHPEYVRESDAAFYVALPDPATGACNAGLLPVFRLWNQRIDSNHRYTTNVFIRGLMLQRGYVSEGYGADGVAFCAESGSQGLPGGGVQNMVVEYYNPERDQYFITATYADINALDSGSIPGWQRTGWTFSAASTYSADLGLTQRVCRFYTQASDSHFYSTAECAQVVQHPDYVVERGNEFYVSPADAATGACLQDFELIPVFGVRRVGIDGGQRFTTNVFIRNLMIQQGYVTDGFGPIGVAFCVPGVAAAP